ncbi:mevalonate kinase [Hortaea werneckii]|nr:mevalonate kinase [Hortaea werneckii]
MESEETLYPRRSDDLSGCRKDHTESAGRIRVDQGGKKETDPDQCLDDGYPIAGLSEGFPHEDKKALQENLAAHMKSESVVLEGFVNVKASLLLNGEAKGLQAVRDGVETQPAVGYTIRRADVGGWIFERLVKGEPKGEWMNLQAYSQGKFRFTVEDKGRGRSRTLPLSCSLRVLHIVAIEAYRQSQGDTTKPFHAARDPWKSNHSREVNYAVPEEIQSFRQGEGAQQDTQGLCEDRALKENCNKRGRQYDFLNTRGYTRRRSEEQRMVGSTMHSNGVNGVHMNGSNEAQKDAKLQTRFTPDTATANGTSRPVHGRKDSNPLAPPFIVSAPGKTIVYGEHAVVHGKAAIAAAISLRSYLLCTTLSKSKRTVTLKFSDIGLDHTWSIPDLPWAEFHAEGKRRRYYDLVTSLDPELVEAMQPHIKGVSEDCKPEMRKIHQNAAAAFLYLFLSLGSQSSPACIYSLRSTIPIAAGLGSSASVSVCISTALLLQCRALAGPHPDQMSKEAAEQLERINRWAFVGELLIHGNPSGVDNTVSTNGHAVLFQRKDYAKPPFVSVLRAFPELPLLLIDTRQAKSTAAEVAKVGNLKATHPEVTGYIFDAIDSITRSAHDIVTSSDPGSLDAVTRLGDLMHVNHGLLSSLGVSHPRLERLRYLVDQSGVGWTKLTGAGGGGCAITLLRPTEPANASAAEAAALNGEAANAEAHPTHSPLQNLERQLEVEGFEKYTTTLGGDGVGVLYPAVLDDEEIDLEMFLGADGRKGVEELPYALRMERGGTIERRCYVKRDFYLDSYRKIRSRESNNVDWDIPSALEFSERADSAATGGYSWALDLRLPSRSGAASLPYNSSPLTL